MNCNGKCRCDDDEFIDDEGEGEYQPIQILWSQDGDVFISADQVLGMIEALASEEAKTSGESNRASMVLDQMGTTILEAIHATMKALVSDFEDAQKTVHRLLQEDDPHVN